MKKQKAIKVGGSVKYVDRRMSRGGVYEHAAKVLAIHGDGSLSLLVNFKSVGKVPFDSVRPLVGNGPEGFR